MVAGIGGRQLCHQSPPVIHGPAHRSTCCLPFSNLLHKHTCAEGHDGNGWRRLQVQLLDCLHQPANGAIATRHQDAQPAVAAMHSTAQTECCIGFVQLVDLSMVHSMLRPGVHRTWSAQAWRACCPPPPAPSGLTRLVRAPSQAGTAPDQTPGSAPARAPGRLPDAGRRGRRCVR